MDKAEEILFKHVRKDLIPGGIVGSILNAMHEYATIANEDPYRCPSCGAPTVMNYRYRHCPYCGFEQHADRFIS